MTDKISKEERSLLMSKIRSKETKLEAHFRKLLWQNGLRYRKNSAKHYGKPDIVNESKKIAVFIDSCFWHGCDKHLRMPVQNKKYWENKINKNIQRDKLVTKYYKNKKWKIFRIWEHDLKKEKTRTSKTNKIMKAYKNATKL